MGWNSSGNGDKFIFNDRKTIFVIYATSIAVWIASAFMYNYSASSAVKALDVRDFAATFLLISCVFAISVILYNFNKLQVEDVVEYYDGEKKLQEKLSTDYLTQLHTRFSIYENIKQAMHDYYFSGKDVCVAMLDIDFFKKVNDTYGHDKGDMVLRTLSRVISQYTDDTIHAGRYGGEEFLILFQDIPESRQERYWKECLLILEIRSMISCLKML